MLDGISVVSHNSSKYDYQFIMKELAYDFEGQFECHGKITEKYKKFSIPIEKGFRKDYEDSNEDITIVSYKIKLIARARFMVLYQILLIISQK